MNVSDNIEIERKYLIKDKRIVAGLVGVPIRQGYLTEDGATVRVRIAGEQGFITIKGKAKGLAKPEYEYEIPVAHAKTMLELFCKGRLIEKTRHVVEYLGQVFEVDVFHGKHEGLVMAELELASEKQVVHLPSWVGAEVSHDKRYTNKRMAVTGMVPC